MEKIYLSPDEYTIVTESYRNKYGYDEMSDDEKAIFDERLSKVVEQKENDAESTDEPDQPERVLKRTR